MSDADDQASERLRITHAGQKIAVHCETLGKEHEWEKVEYDPSVGILTSGRLCVICERFEPYD